MKRDVQSVLLVLIGGAVLRISAFSEVYLRYVKEGLRPFLIAAGACLLLLGLIGAVLDGVLRRQADTSAVRQLATDHVPEGELPTGGDHDHGHDHQRGPRVAWLLCLPVFAIFLIAPDPLGAFAASRDRGTVAPPGDSGFSALPAGNPLRLTLSEFAVRAVWDKSESLKGRTVLLTGFVTPHATTEAWYLTRIVLSCCAADGTPIKIEVRGAESLPADTWVEVTGTWIPTGQEPSESVIPVISAQTVRKISPPKQTYE